MAIKKPTFYTQVSQVTQAFSRTYHHENVERQSNTTQRQRRNLRNIGLRRRLERTNSKTRDDLGPHELSRCLSQIRQSDTARHDYNACEENSASTEFVLDEASGEGTKELHDVVGCVPQGLPVCWNDEVAVDEAGELHPVLLLV